MTEKKAALSKQQVIERFVATRKHSEELCRPLEIEDYGLQAVAETSPAKWHIAHTSWFFETFLLKEYVANYTVHNEHFEHLFNSYYNAIGQPFLRPNRGLLSRPTVQQVMAYRRALDDDILILLQDSSHPQYATILQRIELGIQHEKQHQELFLTDLKFNFFQNPMLPTYLDRPLPTASANENDWVTIPEGLMQVGFNDTGFCFDNELPAHTTFINKTQIATRNVTNAEFLEFINDGGYENPLLWLSDGWSWLNQENVSHPLYWIESEHGWQEFTLYGKQPLQQHAPICHINYFEADAFARWSGQRLPTEFEWEYYASQQANLSNPAVASDYIHPVQPGQSDLFNRVWQWTQSSYSQYPGFQPAAGAVGEYNGKFMSNQRVLRGGSCLSPGDHIRATYRNFFYPTDRWQMSGIRLAKQTGDV